MLFDNDTINGKRVDFSFIHFRLFLFVLLLCHGTGRGTDLMMDGSAMGFFLFFFLFSSHLFSSVDFTVCGYVDAVIDLHG